MKKPTIHIGKSPHGDGPPRMGANVFCGRPAGSTLGVLAVDSLLGWGDIVIAPGYTYSVHFTRKGLKFSNDNFREAAAKSCKMYGYYNQYLEGCQFEVCKECLDSEEFGIMVLAELP